MKIIPLPSETRLNSGFSVKVRVAYTDVNATAGLTKTLTLYPDGTGQLPAGFAVRRVGYQLITPFTGGAVATCTLDLGDKASASRYLAAANSDLFTAIATNTKAFVMAGALVAGYAFQPVDVTNTNAQLTGLFTTTVANLNALTAGLVEIYYELIDLSRLDDPIEPGTV